MDDEINALKMNKTFEVIEKPIARNIVGIKGVFKTKQNAVGTVTILGRRGSIGDDR